MIWLSRIAERFTERIVQKHLQESFAAGHFDEQIERAVVDTVREARDDGLSLNGFVLKIVVELIDKSSPPLSFKQAKAMAHDLFEQFCKDNKIRSFGEEGWDWSGRGARELAHEYEIQYWEPHP